MLTLLKNLRCYCPEYTGKKDILLCGDKIYKICSEIKENELIENVFDFEGSLAFPGIIDLHVHITGGGGEEGFSSRIGEIDSKDIFKAGVTTVVGILGADSQTKSIQALYAKARSLEDKGLTTFIYCGSYTLPPVTITGSVIKDVTFVDKVIGVGEIALSDHRGSQAGISELLRISSEVHLGAILAGKSGIVHFHLGDGKEGLMPLIKIIEKSNLPKKMFLPTHVNRNKALFEQAVCYAKKGGLIDLTADERAGLAVPDAVTLLIKYGVDLSNVTVSSDANGSCPGGRVCEISSLYSDISKLITEKNISPEAAISLVTKNAAKRLKIYPKKGALKEGGDADILITDKDLKIKQLICMGQLKL